MIVAEGTPVQIACRVVGISESGWYARIKRTPSQRSIRHALLSDLIIQIHRDSRGTYGGRRVHAELTLGRGIAVGHGQVELLMRRAGLQGVGGRSRWKRVKPDNIATDLVKRDFARPGPNQLWVTDITEHPTREGKVYCCVVLDTFSRRVVGWSIDNSPTAALAPTRSAWPLTPASATPTRPAQRSTPTRASNSLPGHSLDARKSPVSCPRWAAWATATTTR